MGLMNTIRNALGLQRPLTPQDPDTPLALSPAALQRLSELPPGHGIHVSTVPAERGRVVHVEEGPSQGPPPPQLLRDGITDLALTISNEDLQHLRGLTLDHRDGRWALKLELELRARETPNPDGRLYLADRWLALGRPLFFTRESPALPDLPARLLEHPEVKTVLLRDNTITIEREPGISWDVLDRTVDGVLRQYLLMCGHEIEAEVLAEREDPFEQAVLQVLKERIAPAIHRDGGDIELVGVTDGVVRVSMVGACRSCPASTATLRLGVERTLKEAFPGLIDRVESV